ncbi:MAG: ATP-dependent Clp protease ATP-binding subunit ClpX [Candidatus Delongbacteria bacterium]|nr:ATP-dependent Clp protease ATP-binding subunit ClpX [bacterium]MBL7032822.1 ATP-dependent Clp protease ATP-binding subunit ClpX [Candidatus Delongbacteria bacterium]
MTTKGHDNLGLETPRCSFCGRTSDQVQIMITGPEVNICDECVEASGRIIQRNLSQRKSFNLKQFPNPREIKTRLDEYVIGQNEAKRALSVAVYNHYKRITQESAGTDVEIEKSNIMLVGPTGTGKTLLAQTLARFLQVPFTIADATVLTEAGYVGEDVENILVRLLRAANYDVPAAEMGIIYIDEIDKIARRDANTSITRDVSGEGVQQAMLKLLEGTIAAVPPEGGRKHPEQKLININTRNILFIVGGSFDGLEKIIEHRLSSSSMGFGATPEKQEQSRFELLQKIEYYDLIRYGLIPELIGRLPVITALDELTEDALRDILLNPRNALTRQFIELLKLDGIELSFTDKALTAIVKLAKKRKTGARALRSIMEATLRDSMFELPGDKSVKRVTIDHKVVEGKGKPLVERRQQSGGKTRQLKKRTG